MRTVVLGGGQRVTLRAYVAAWRQVRAADPDTEYGRGLTSPAWCGPVTGREILAQFRAALHDRINRQHRRIDSITDAPRDPRAGWRKMAPSWWWATWRAAQDLNTPRLIVRPSTIPAWLRPRMAHRLFQENDA